MNNRMKIKHAFNFLFNFYKHAFTYRLHAPTDSLQKKTPKIKARKSCLVSLLNQHYELPSPFPLEFFCSFVWLVFFFFFFFFFFCFFKIGQSQGIHSGKSFNLA